ncbi:hypothetical protein [Christiangramia sabulilitoris]|uniref:Lipoprotein n=1 Tax=Christiangramia sabulilitoris TaxID=2583991 RepID=A0A550I407_9FLAO|nr:hypothetical protein [Christiangramia sabulilitoris]TRO65707.1 hypothetical protein FGM01_09935 [Christiangramia sabulilitoris]
MYNKKFIQLIFSGFLFSFLLTSCFKDVDFSQAENLSMEPDLEVDLLYYKLNELDFLDSETSAYTPAIRDTVRLEFLDDDYIQDGLVYAALRFKHENVFPYEINTNIRFLDKNGRNQFNVIYTIPEGFEGSPAVIDTLRVLEGDEIQKMRRSIQMVIDHEVIGGDEKLQGNLKFMSKGLFRFEF